MDRIDQLVEQSVSYDEQKETYTVNWSAMRFDKKRLVVPADSPLFANGAVALDPTDWAMRQLAIKLGPAYWNKPGKMLPLEYFNNLPVARYDELLNYHLSLGNGKPVRTLSYQDSARAFLSENYAEIPNTDTLRWAQDAFNRGGKGNDYKMINGWVSPDSLEIKAMVYNRPTPDGPYGLGVCIRNGEIGNSKLAACALIQRHSCTNSIIVNKELAYEAFHRGNSQVLRISFVAAIAQAIIDSNELVDRMIAAYDIQIPTIEDVLQKLAKDNGWENEFTTTVAMGTENSSTLAGLVNGISHGAKFTESEEERTKMETLAGNLLVAPPESLFGRAAVAMREQLEMRVGVLVER